MGAPVAIVKAWIRIELAKLNMIRDYVPVNVPHFVNGPIPGHMVAGDPETLSAVDTKELRTGGNLRLQNRLDDSFVQRERSVLGLSVQKQIADLCVV